MLPVNPLFIAVIDDDRSVCKALQRLLRAAQMEVETYSSGETFLHTALRRDPDCLILDVRMPGLTGPDLRNQLDGMGRRIPVVFITAHPEDGAPGCGLTGDGGDVLRKPFGDKALLNAIERAVHGQEVR